MTDRRRGLTEICRVVRPGGLFVILELTEPTGFIMRPMFRIYAGLIMPLLTKIMSSVSAYRYLSASMADFPRPETFTELDGRGRFCEHKAYAHDRRDRNPVRGGSPLSE